MKFIPINNNFSVRHAQELAHNKKQPITDLSHDKIPVGCGGIPVRNLKSRGVQQTRVGRGWDCK